MLYINLNLLHLLDQKLFKKIIATSIIGIKEGDNKMNEYSNFRILEQLLSYKKSYPSINNHFFAVWVEIMILCIMNYSLTVGVCEFNKIMGWARYFISLYTRHMTHLYIINWKCNLPDSSLQHVNALLILFQRYAINSPIHEKVIGMQKSKWNVCFKLKKLILTSIIIRLSLISLVTPPLKR